MSRRSPARSGFAAAMLTGSTPGTRSRQRSVQGGSACKNARARGPFRQRTEMRRLAPRTRRSRKKKRWKKAAKRTPGRSGLLSKWSVCFLVGQVSLPNALPGFGGASERALRRPQLRCRLLAAPRALPIRAFSSPRAHLAWRRSPPLRLGGGRGGARTGFRREGALPSIHLCSGRSDRSTRRRRTRTERGSAARLIRLLRMSSLASRKVSWFLVRRSFRFTGKFLRSSVDDGNGDLSSAA